MRRANGATVRAWQCMTTTSVTRFGEISPLWQKNKVFGHFWYGLISIVQTFLPNMAIFYATRQILIVENGQVLINNLAIWSY